MNAKPIDRAFKNEEPDLYFYVAVKNDGILYGGHFQDGDLTTMLNYLFDNAPSTRHDLIAFASGLVSVPERAVNELPNPDVGHV